MKNEMTATGIMPW